MGTAQAFAPRGLNNRGVKAFGHFPLPSWLNQSEFAALANVGFAPEGEALVQIPMI